MHMRNQFTLKHRQPPLWQSEGEQASRCFRGPMAMHKLCVVCPEPTPGPTWVPCPITRDPSGIRLGSPRDPCSKRGIRRGSARDPHGIRAQNAGSCSYHRFPIYKNIDVGRDPPQPNFAFIKLKRGTHELFAVATCPDPVLSRILHRPVVRMPCNNSWKHRNQNSWLISKLSESDSFEINKEFCLVE